MHDRLASLKSLSLFVLLLAGCQAPVTPPPERGVSLELAQSRAQSISELSYHYFLEVPRELDAAIEGIVDISVTTSQLNGPLVLDFRQPAESVHDVQLNGRPASFRVENDHIMISDVGDGRHELEISFTAGDSSLNRTEDYLYALFVPDRASVAFPCFDQPDLKASFALTLDLPEDWVAVANGAENSDQTRDGRRTMEFGKTKPISTYLFSFAAGIFQKVEHDGDRAMAFYHRETDEQKVERNSAKIFELHEAALDFLEDYTGIDYPFGKFEFVLIPAFQYGGMEHPGTIFYRDAGLLLDESATQGQVLGRASVIAHETAHMWFGDLVTMRWFDDVWMKEVFANFMAAKVANPTFPEMNHELRFLLRHYPAAYTVDRTPGANPIKQQLGNLLDAGTMYGAIIYQKAPIVMRQLELLLGEEAFRDGLRRYLEKFSYANATWHDLVEILDAQSDRDLRNWSRTWVEEPGRPRLEATATPTGFQVHQSDPQDRQLIWNQALFPVWVDERGAAHPLGRMEIGRGSDYPSILEIEHEEASGGALIPGGRGFGYGLFLLDRKSQDWLLGSIEVIEDPLARAAGWMALWDAMLETRLAAPDLIPPLLRALKRENEELNLAFLLGRMEALFWGYLGDSGRATWSADLEAAIWTRLSGSQRTSERSSLFSAYRNIASSPEGIARLAGIWDGSQKAPVPLSERDRIRLAQQLALLRPAQSQQILDRQAEEIQNPDRRDQFDFVRPALSSDPVERVHFFESLSTSSNREHEPWVLRGLGFLHHPLRARDSERFIRPSLDLLIEIQQTGDIFFPKRWLDVTLGGHSSLAAAQVVREFLATDPDYPPRLRAKILQSADQLFRKSSIRQ